VVSGELPIAEYNHVHGLRRASAGLLALAKRRAADAHARAGCFDGGWDCYGFNNTGRTH
jgi:hypothetical protein